VPALRMPALDGAFDYGIVCPLDGLESRQPANLRRHASHASSARPQKAR
jgi:hypothetical protein